MSGVDQKLLKQLHIACEFGNELKVREWLIGTTCVDSVDQSCWNETALHAACRGENCNIVELLLAHGANLEVRGWNGWTPLHYAAVHMKLDIVKLLLDRGAEINARDIHGSTALYKVVSDAAIVKELLARGAIVNSNEKTNPWPLLHTAARDGSLESVRLLLAAGANVHARSRFGGQTALDVARSRAKFVPSGSAIAQCLEEAVARSWSKEVHRDYLHIAIALAPLNLPTYILLWLLDWLPEFALKPEIKKIRLLERIYESRRRRMLEHRE